MPQPPLIPRPDIVLAEQAKYSIETLRSYVTFAEPLLNPEQLQVYNQVMDAVRFSQPLALFVDSPGGCGKTFTLNLLLAAVRSLPSSVALAVATSGIAALLLDGGTTAHSRFKIPINLDEHSTCHMKRQDEVAELIKAAKLIVWDEAPMAHKHCYGALDRLLKDIMDS